MAKFDGVAKISINGETFSYDFGKKPMSECFAIEKALGMRYSEYEEGLESGDLRCVCTLVWTVLRRNDRNVELQDILDGKIDFDLYEVAEGLEAFAAEAQKAAKDAEANPTSAAGRRTGRAGSATTGTATSRSSRSTSA